MLEGKQQSKPNSFIEMSQRACEYFERAYGSLEARTRKKIQFKQTLVCNYSQAVLPKIKDKPKFKGSSKTGRATTLNFLISIFQKQRGGSERKVATLSLTWRFPVASVLAQETADFDAIARYHTHRGTALVGCVAEYEVVGRKGTPVSLSLQNVEGFADVARGGGRGAFVPAQDRIESLTALWWQAIATAASQLWLPQAELSGISQEFNDFESAYNSAVVTLRKSAFAPENAADVATAYRSLLLRINQIQHQDARRQLPSNRNAGGSCPGFPFGPTTAHGSDLPLAPAANGGACRRASSRCWTSWSSCSVRTGRLSRMAPAARCSFAK